MGAETARAVAYIETLDPVSAPRDDLPGAVWTIRAFRSVPRDVSDVHVPEPFLAAGFVGGIERRHGCRGEVLQAVLRVESRKVDRNVGSEIGGDPARHVPDAGRSVVQGRHDEIHELEPDPPLVDRENGIEHGREGRVADIPVVRFVEGFEIYLDRIDEIAEIEEGFPAQVAVRYDDALDIPLSREPRDVLYVFNENDGLGVGEGDGRRAKRDCLIDDTRRRREARFGVLGPRLRNLPVLAEFAF